MPPYTGSQLTYADQFQQAMVAALALLPTPSQLAQGSMIYSRACYEHCITDSALFWGASTPGLKACSLRQLQPRC